VGPWVFPKNNGVSLRDKDGKELSKWSVTAGQVVAIDGKRVAIRHSQYPGPYDVWVSEDDLVSLAAAPHYFGKRVSADEGDGWARVMRATARSLRGEHEDAVKDLTEVIRTHPSADLHDLRGGALLTGGEIDAAIADFDKAIQLDSKRASTFSNRGIARTLKGDLAQATEDFSESIRIDPNYARAYHNRGLAWSARGEPNRAIEDYSAALRLSPQLHEVLRDRALAWIATGKYDSAIQDFDRLIQLDPNDVRALKGRGDARRHNADYDGAMRDYSVVIQIDPKNAGAFQDRGNAYRAKGQFDRAVADYGAAIRLTPNNVTLLQDRAELWWKLGQAGKSIADLTAAIRLEPKEASHYYSRGFIWNYQKNYDRALADYTTAARLNPDDLRSMNAIAWLLATCPEEKFRDGKQAVELANKACELSRWKDPHHLGSLAAAWAESGDFEKAVAYQNKALELPGYDEAQSREAQYRLRLYRERKPYRQPPAQKR
jgi:tetratricopeptide (TPR) repeat protein